MTSLSIGQNNDSLGRGIEGVYVSGGANVVQFYNGDFFNNKISNLVLPPVNGSPYSGSTYNYNSLYPGINISGNTNKFQIVRSNYSTDPIVGLGLEINSSTKNNIKINHVIEVSYMSYSGTYSYLENFSEDWYNHSSPARGWNSSLNDTTLAKLNASTFSIGYKYQPSYESFFLSIGMNFIFNHFNLDVHRSGFVTGSSFDEYAGSFFYAKNYSSDTSSSVNYINFPFQFGIGGYIKMNKISLKPAFYFSPCLMQGYLFYNASIAVLFDTKRR